MAFDYSGKKKITRRQRKIVNSFTINKKVKKIGYRRKDKIKKWCVFCEEWYLVVSRTKCDICTNELVPYTGQDKEE